MKTYTLNFEAPGATAALLTAQLADAAGVPGSVKLRPHQAGYLGPNGPVVTESWVAQVTTTKVGTAFQTDMFLLAAMHYQDCVAVRDDSTGQLDLIGPRAHRWLPANPAFFVSY